MRLPPLPDIDWTPEGAPRARGFDDIYFSREGGLAETQTVFLDGCGLPDFWRDRARFTVGELGFGSGLNALALWRLWRQHGPPRGMLHMVSVEGFLLPQDAARRALAPFEAVGDLAERLLARWPRRASGPQRLWFAEDRFCLTLIVDEAERALAGFEGQVDCWFLDGFAPLKNPAMWSDGVMRRIAALSAPGARLATYSVAAAVRAQLTNHNFVISRKPGFGAKRERLEARFDGVGAPRKSAMPHKSPRRVAVIGGGIAGAAMARALQRRGVAVALFEAAPELASAASGNPVALLMPRLDRTDTPLARFFRAAYLFALDVYRQDGVFGPVGVREPARDADDVERLNDFRADPPLPSDLLQFDTAALLHPRAGLVRPQPTIALWCAGTEVYCNQPLVAIRKDAAGWNLIATDGRREGPYDAVVVAAGPAAATFEQTAWVPLSASRGQIDFGPLVDGAGLESAIAAGAYCAPYDTDRLVFGATFDRVALDARVEADARSTARNLDALAALAPEVAAAVDRDRLEARAAIRASTPDRAPIAGLVPDASAFLERHADVAHGRTPDLSEPSPAHEGLYLLGGLGARGFLVAPFLGEILASELLGEPSPLDAEARDAIHPARFLLRALKKGRPVSWARPSSSE
jgi:tRNA 5-methylaminomethyl-2-thiouridine biosynthesis bifunctional protein